MKKTVFTAFGINIPKLNNNRAAVGCSPSKCYKEEK